MRCFFKIFSLSSLLLGNFLTPAYANPNDIEDMATVEELRSYVYDQTARLVPTMMTENLHSALTYLKNIVGNSDNVEHIFPVLRRLISNLSTNSESLTDAVTKLRTLVGGDSQKSIFSNIEILMQKLENVPGETLAEKINTLKTP